MPGEKPGRCRSPRRTWLPDGHDAARARRGRPLHGGRANRRRAGPRPDARDGGVRRGLPRRHARRLRAQERPLGRRRGDRPRDPPHPGRLRHAPQRPARLGLRGGARLALRAGLPRGRPTRERSPTCSSTSPACPTFPIVDFLPVRNEVEWQRYPKAGRPERRSCAWASSASTRTATPGPERLVSFTPDDVYVLPQLGWTPDSRERGLPAPEPGPERAGAAPAAGARPRPASRLGAPRTVLTERSTTWLNTFGPPRFLKDGRRFLWLSERDGFAHLYLCDVAGGCRAVTQGPWMVDGRVSFAGAGPGFVLDERSGFLYFTATEKDPRERHLYRVRLDGTGRTRLTREDGTHRTVVSPDGRFYADTWSDAAHPAAGRGCRARTARSARRSRRTPTRRSSASSAAPIEWVELKAKDGTTLYASLLKPADFDPAKRYPVIVSVYGGPHAQTVANAWGSVSPFEHLLASHGFLVWSLDNRGTAARGTASSRAIYHDLGRVELEDQLAGVEYLKSLPYVDPARIGIWGWSYGGYMTLYAADQRPGRLPGRGGRRAGHRLEALRLDLHRALHGTPEEQPEGLRDELAAPEGRPARGRPAAHPRHRRRQRPPRQHPGVRGRPHQGGQAVRAADPPPPAARVPGEGGPHRARPRDPRPLRADAAAARRRPPRRRAPWARYPPLRPGRRREAAARTRPGTAPPRPRTPHEARAGTVTTASPPRTRHCSARRGRPAGTAP